MCIRDRFSSVGRYSPTASRSASSETYLVCQNKLPKPRGIEEGVTAMDQLRIHLASIGIVVEQEEPEGDTKVGFRKLERKE